jgi:hypothetical protein
VVPEIGSVIFASRLSIGPTAFTGEWPGTKIPAESYPLYSKVLNPSIKIGVAVRLPVYPKIPHI